MRQGADLDHPLIRRSNNFCQENKLFGIDAALHCAAFASTTRAIWARSRAWRCNLRQVVEIRFWFFWIGVRFCRSSWTVTPTSKPWAQACAHGLIREGRHVS